MHDLNELRFFWKFELSSNKLIVTNRLNKMHNAPKWYLIWNEFEMLI